MSKIKKKSHNKESSSDLLASLDSSYLDIVAQAIDTKYSGSNTALYEARKAHEKIESKELQLVLSNYDIGKIVRTKIFPRGSRSSPKVLLRSDRNLYLLKRRAGQLSHINKVVFSHQFQHHIYRLGFPLAKLIDTKEGRSFLVDKNDGAVYEMFEYVKGNFYDKSIESTYQCGKALGDLHKFSKDFESKYKPSRGSYHDLDPIRQIMEGIPETVIKTYPRRSETKYNKLQKLINYLQACYDKCAENVNNLGFDKFPQQIIHGDWHPGNMRFDGQDLKSVLDYDSVRYGKPITDVANGLLQFSVVGGNPKLHKWPDYLDEDRFTAFVQGYNSTIDIKLKNKQLKSIPFLMAEALIAESAIPIAATGKFSHVDGYDFLGMVKRKVDWITSNTKKLSKLARG